MHIRTNHLNTNAPLESDAAARAAASQRAADIRKKLLNNASGKVTFNGAWTQNVRVEEKEDGAPHRRDQYRRPRSFKAADASEDESATEQRTSVWA